MWAFLVAQQWEGDAGAGRRGWCQTVKRTALTTLDQVYGVRRSFQAMEGGECAEKIPKIVQLYAVGERAAALLQSRSEMVKLKQTGRGPRQRGRPK